MYPLLNRGRSDGCPPILMYSQAHHFLSQALDGTQKSYENEFQKKVRAASTQIVHLKHHRQIASSLNIASVCKRAERRVNQGGLKFIPLHQSISSLHRKPHLKPYVGGEGKFISANSSSPIYLGTSNLNTHKLHPIKPTAFQSCITEEKT